jgi:putative spermidine/putrescine transport system permease protein
VTAIAGNVGGGVKRAALRRRFDPLALLAIPAAAYFVVALVFPLGRLLLDGFSDGDGVGIGNFTRYLSDPYNLGVVWNTLRYGALVTIVAAIGGYAYAYTMARSGPKMQMLLLIAIVLPMTTSVIVKAFGWLVLLRSNGLVNQLLMASGIVREPLPLLFSQPGLIVGTASILLPYMVLPIFGVLRQIHPDLLGAAATLGGSPVYCFRKVILPLSLPGLIAGICFVFSMTVSAYVIPSLLTGAGFKTLSKVAADSYLVILNPVRGATVSLILLVIAFAAVFLAGRVVNRKPGQARA